MAIPPVRRSAGQNHFSSYLSNPGNEATNTMSSSSTFGHQRNTSRSAGSITSSSSSILAASPHNGSDFSNQHGNHDNHNSHSNPRSSRSNRPPKNSRSTTSNNTPISIHHEQSNYSANRDRSLPIDLSSDLGSDGSTESYRHQAPEFYQNGKTTSGTKNQQSHLSPLIHDVPPSMQASSSRNTKSVIGHVWTQHRDEESSTFGQSQSQSQNQSQHPTYVAKAKRSAVASDMVPHNSKSARKVIEDLDRATGPERRIVAITNACAEFDHIDESKHNAELHFGAASTLSKTLSVTDDDDEIRMICAAIEMVFRGSAKYVHVAFDKVGSTMIPLLLRILDRCESGNMRHADVSILNITKTLLYASRIPDLRVCLARQQGVLDAMRRVATSILNPDCRIARVRIVANLANCPANKVLMLEHEGLLNGLLRICHLDLSEIAREYASTTLMDLASEPANQVPMAMDEKLLGSLVKMVLVEKIATTRESAITALQNLAFTKDNRKLLVNFKSGIVLEALRKALNSDKNDKARRRAAGALTNLACEETSEIMGSHKGLLESLAIVSTKDENVDVQMRSSLALTKIASHVSIRMACYEALLDALVVSSLSIASNSVSAVIRVKARDAENRASMARHSGILDTLADICVSPGAKLKDKDNAMRALMHLTNENANCKLMCNKSVLDALIKGAAAVGKDRQEMRESAMKAMERLATDTSNRPYMARHEGLLVVVAQATEREAKLEGSGVKVDRAMLAKPLLMSLLVAM